MSSGGSRSPRRDRVHGNRPCTGRPGGSTACASASPDTSIGHCPQVTAPRGRPRCRLAITSAAHDRLGRRRLLDPAGQLGIGGFERGHALCEGGKLGGIHVHRAPPAALAASRSARASRSWAASAAGAADTRIRPDLISNQGPGSGTGTPSGAVLCPAGRAGHRRYQYRLPG